MDSTTRTLLVTLGVLLVVALGFSALMGGVIGPAGPAMMPGHGWMWGVGMGLGGLVMLTFWGALIVGIVLLVRSMGVGGSPVSHSTSLDTLKRRYAAGEITREQYELARKTSRSRAPATRRPTIAGRRRGNRVFAICASWTARVRNPITNTR